MKTKSLFVLAMLTAMAIASAEAQLTTSTLSFSGATWSDGGSLDGYFTIEYNNGTPFAVLSLNVITGNGTSDGFIGFNYIYNVAGQNDTVDPDNIYINVTQFDGYPANELFASDSADNYELYLDWQGDSPTSLFVGDVGAQYSSEAYDGSPGIRSLNDEGGSAGSVPEPSTPALAGLGGLGLLLFRRRKS
jgi:hypothetical protein